ncbi:CoA transferase [Massilia sp. W12]|uniref:CoA transferase n=1 Tax=Massilia sp. W12 TaxID=3126507 RepID=UPI0030D60409
MPTHDITADLWRLLQLPPAALNYLTLTGADPVLPSSFRVGAAAQATVAAAALAAAELHHVRGAPRQAVAVDMLAAAMECCGWFSVDGNTPAAWEKFSGLYPCQDGFVRIHANFPHHRDGALDILGLSAASAEKEDVIRALQSWRAQAFEEAANARGLVVSAMRSFAEWDMHPQAAALAAQPLLTLRKIGAAPPLNLPGAGEQPLSGVRVLDLTRIIAGPVGARTLAAHGADVLMINAPHLTNINALMDMSRGKRSALLDLRQQAGQDALRALLRDCHIFIQGYRPGGLAQLGFEAGSLAALRPGIIAVSLSAYGTTGPWAQRRGFDSLVQTASGFNHAEAQAFGSAQAKALPVQILDYASGFLIAYAAQAALLKQIQEGGSWAVEVSLAQTAQWLRSLGQISDGIAFPLPDHLPFTECSASGFGRMQALRHSAQLRDTPARYRLPAMAPGSHAPHWLA